MTTLRDALDKIRRYGALELRPGGFWTYPGCPQDGVRPPEWSISHGTIAAMLSRGFCTEGERQWDTRGYSFIVEVLP